jgi:hypothetical protein
VRGSTQARNIRGYEVTLAEDGVLGLAAAKEQGL